jgi:hypothetical protein
MRITLIIGCFLILWSVVAESIKTCQLSQNGLYRMPIPFHQILPNLTFPTNFPNLTVQLNYNLIKKGILSMNPQHSSVLPKHFKNFFHKLSCGENVTIMVTGVCTILFFLTVPDPSSHYPIGIIHTWSWYSF